MHQLSTRLFKTWRTRGRAWSGSNFTAKRSSRSRGRISVGGAVRNDVTQLLPRLDTVSAAVDAASRPRYRPDVLLAGRGYDRDK
ncbi:hypothetical protein [Streptomyces sp. NPDC054837]